MVSAGLRLAAATALAAMAIWWAPAPGQAQNSEPKAAPKAQSTDGDGGRRDGQQQKLDEFAEAAKMLDGPAGHPECVWLGRRVVGLMWRDDLDTAFRHLDLYDRFGCPGGHIQATFRCLVRQGNIDPKPPESLSRRVHACWINPNLDASTPEPAAASAPPGTTNR